MDEKMISSWSDLASLAERYKRERWIFRGVGDSAYELIPKIGRNGIRKDNNSGSPLPFSEDGEVQALDRYMREVRTLVQVEPQDRLEWMALAQHHGLNTRLIDWSESPLIAAYFALERAGIYENRLVDAALYGVCCPKVVRSYSEFSEGNDVVAYYPPHLTPRITVQRGLFTVHKEPGSCWNPNCLVKWTIPSRACFELKLSLAKAGFNRASLFPDLDGIAGHVNWVYKWGLF